MNKYPLLAITALAAGCSMAPDFILPEMHVPETFKEQRVSQTPQEMPPVAGIWKEAVPLEQDDRGQWWKIFGDEALNALEAQATGSNQSLKAAAARVQQARALAKSNVPSLLPNIDIGGNALRAQPSTASVAAFGGTATALNPYTLYSAQGVASYEADLFGRVRDGYQAYLFDADAAEASYRSALLALQADVAQHYFSLRALDSERTLLRETVAIREEAARIMQKRFDIGDVGEQDLSRTLSELASVRADLIALDRARAEREHALAILLGAAPSEFSFDEAPLMDVPPEIPAGFPSSLLQRRPDIATAIASMAAANARIGVARTAFFPRLILGASGGFEANSLGDVFQWSSRNWALGQLAGMALTMPVFDNGRNLAKLDAAGAVYDEAVANYRQQVLVAFKDVEDSLTHQRLLADQSHQQDTAAAAARRTTAIVQKRYDEGDADYFELVDTQRNSLMVERAAVQVRGQRLLATVTLIRALGGGWENIPVQESPLLVD